MHAVEPDIRQEILKRLHAVEEEHNVRILYACESGSRAWGFASADSDYDVRFIYAHPEEWYLSFDVERRRDVIEYPIVDEIDCNGWDVRKAMYLLTRTNGALLEWLKSPIRYIEVGELAENLRRFSPEAINHLALCYHYSHMARANARGYLLKEHIKLKKYFYVLRPLLAINYIQKYNTPPPVEFEKLVDSVAPESIRASIRHLLEAKRNAPELGLGEPIPEINNYVYSELERHGETFSGQGRPDILTKKASIDVLNSYFRQALKGET